MTAIDPGALQRQWDRIVSIATLGTSRVGLADDLVWPGGTAAPVSGSPERTLLRLAVASSLIWTAGARASTASEESAPPTRQEPPRREAPPAFAPVSGSAALRLIRMLEGEHRLLMPEWFALARQAGRVLPPGWLPPVLDALTPEMRRRWSAVLGEYGVWLARRNPAWAFRPGDEPPSEDRWLHGTPAERITELTAMRRADPDRAREWVEASWSTDPPEEREAFVRALLLGLSLADEPFLERALDDKRKEVRGAAVECLLLLPDSAHGVRMRERADAVVRRTRGVADTNGPAAPRLDIQLPSAPEAAAIRDGIAAKPRNGRKKVGDRVFWLTQIVAAVPPQHWRQRFACEPREFVASMMATDHAAELLDALTAAATRHPDLAWVEPLAEAWTGRTDDGSGAPALAVVSLLRVLPPAEQERRLERWLASLPPAQSVVALTVLTELPLAWSDGLTRAAFERLMYVCRHDDQRWTHPRTTLASWALHADIGVAPALASAALEGCSSGSPWHGALVHLTEMLEFRADMHRELRT